MLYFHTLDALERSADNNNNNNTRNNNNRENDNSDRIHYQKITTEYDYCHPTSIDYKKLWKAYNLKSILIRGMNVNEKKININY